MYFLVQTPVRLLNHTDQYRTEDNGEIHLQNPYQSHSLNREQGNSIGSPQTHSHHEGQGSLGNSNAQNGDAGNPGRLQVLTPVPKRGGRFLQNGRTEAFRAEHFKIKHLLIWGFQDNKEGTGLIYFWVCRHRAYFIPPSWTRRIEWNGGEPPF